jgi:hypothetical protein
MLPLGHLLHIGWAKNTPPFKIEINKYPNKISTFIVKTHQGATKISKD